MFNYGLWTMDYGLIYAQDIIAVVNNEIITQKDLDDFVNFTRMQYSRDYQGEELAQKIKELKPELLNKLIEDALILQEAKRKNIVVDESRVKGQIDEIKKEYGSEARFQEALRQQGLVQADLETRLRNQFLTYGIIQSEVRSNVIVRPEEVTAFYNHNGERFISPQEREVIVITLENADQAKTFAYHLKSGQKLEELAARYPISVNRLKIAENENLKEEIKKAVFNLGIGEASDPLEIEGKHYVFRVENIIPARKLSLREAQEEINGQLYETKMQQAFDKWLKELKERSYIKIIKEIR